MREDIYSLHRYFIWANRMRTDFYALLKSEYGHPVDEDLALKVCMIEPYASYWYGGLYAVAEGWKELGFSDPEIDVLLADQANVDVLRRYRNGAFHYQRQYFDGRFTDLISEGMTMITWVSDLNREFGRYFLEQYGLVSDL